MASLDRKPLAAALSEDRVAVSTKAELRNTHLVSGRSFAGSKTSLPEAAVNWALGPDFSDLEDPERVKVTAFAMSYFTAVTGRKSTALCTHGANGEVSATLLVQQCNRAPGSSPMDTFYAIGNTIKRLARKELPNTFAKKDPESRARKKRIEQRIDVVTTTLERMHKENADAPHVYIALLATDPDHQRKGFGGSLMRAALRAADDAGLPVYLETGESNRKFYEGFGFEVRQTYSLSDDGDEGWPDYKSYYAMVRKARRDKRPMTDGHRGAPRSEALSKDDERRAREGGGSQLPGKTLFTGKSARRVGTVAPRPHAGVGNDSV